MTDPGDALVDVGGGVGETLDLAGLSAKQAVEVRSDLVGLALAEGVALGTSGLRVSADRARSSIRCRVYVP